MGWFDLLVAALDEDAKRRTAQGYVAIMSVVGAGFLGLLLMVVLRRMLRPRQSSGSRVRERLSAWELAGQRALAEEGDAHLPKPTKPDPPGELDDGSKDTPHQPRDER